ncbi:uncharacterized protein BKA78DRAFT_76515 [Phyllosticta capitalensis]|uniref:uncharacterized protein n=1 Tax=Phyllosticta capitalensis TaxID=121624 RepID=UPI00312CC8D5
MGKQLAGLSGRNECNGKCSSAFLPTHQLVACTYVCPSPRVSLSIQQAPSDFSPLQRFELQGRKHFCVYASSITPGAYQISDRPLRHLGQLTLLCLSVDVSLVKASAGERHPLYSGAQAQATKTGCVLPGWLSAALTCFFVCTFPCFSYSCLLTMPRVIGAALRRQIHLRYANY